MNRYEYVGKRTEKMAKVVTNLVDSLSELYDGELVELSYQITKELNSRYPEAFLRDFPPHAGSKPIEEDCE